MRSQIYKYISEKGYKIINGEVFYKDRKKTPKINTKQYYTINVRGEDNKMKPILIHRLLAYQKFGDIIFDNNIVVRHIDGNSLNNNYDNIQIGTNSDNSLDIPKEKRIEIATNASSYIKKYDYQDVQNFYISTKSYIKTMEHFQISSKGTLHYILNKKL